MPHKAFFIVVRYESDSFYVHRARGSGRRCTIFAIECFHVLATPLTRFRLGFQTNPGEDGRMDAQLNFPIPRTPWKNQSKVPLATRKNLALTRVHITRTFHSKGEN